MPSSKFQPALYGGLVLGVLSALPIISAGNICCCLWILAGGALAAYLLQANQPTPVSLGDGAAVGLLAGLIGGVVWQVLSIPISIATGPLQAQLLERLLARAGEIPENVRPLLEAARQAPSGGFMAVRFIVGLFFTLIVGGLFSAIGGLLGAAIFAKKPEPPVVPPLPPTPPVSASGQLE